MILTQQRLTTFEVFARRATAAILAAALVTALPHPPACAAGLRLKVTPQANGQNVPVSVPVELPGDLAKVSPERIHVTMTAGKETRPGQIVAGGGGAELWWILPAAKANEATTWTADLTHGKTKSKPTFSFKDTPGAHLDVLCEGKPVTRYMYARDTSTKERAHETYKVYNHVFDADGREVITKGAGGLYTHHRGIFIGWSRTRFDGGSHDTWHMKTTTQEHQKFLSRSAGPVLARFRALIYWNISGPKTILAEQREITIYRQPAPAIMLMDFRTKLSAAYGDVRLDGDPEHAGCQYRPHNDVATAKSAKYLFHADGVNPTRQLDLPWVAMTYGLKGKQYHVQHMSHPDIPKGSRYSAYRPYGRFGAYFKKDIPRGETLELRYRFYVGAGEMPSREAFAARHAAFAAPPKVEVLK